MVSHKRKFWVENPTELFSTPKLLPLEGMTIESKLNALTRIVILIWIILIIFKVKWNWIFLVFGLIIIIGLYYMQKMSVKEGFEHQVNQNEASLLNVPSSGKFQNKIRKMRSNFSPLQQNKNNLEYFKMNPRSRKYKNAENISTIGTRSYSSQSSVPQAYKASRNPNGTLFCNDSVDFQQGTNYKSSNHQLMGGGKVNPKTLINPIIAPPTHDFTHWKNGELPSMMNQERTDELYLSGYSSVRNECSDPYQSTFDIVKGIRNDLGMNEKYLPGNGNGNGNMGSQRSEFGDVITSLDLGDNESGQGNIREGYQHDIPVINTNAEIPAHTYPGDVVDSCGYDADLIHLNLPVNTQAGPLAQDPVFNDYNKNLYTQTIQPGVYTQSEVNDTVNANLGISFTQQFNPRFGVNNSDGSTTYKTIDPRNSDVNTQRGNDLNYGPQDSVLGNDFTDYANIYDPRLTGAGTSYRSYIDEMTGQVRYDYSDIDAHKRPNLIIKSNVDIFDFAEQTGPMRNGFLAERLAIQSRELAQAKFTEDTIAHRNDITERLMRKNNNIAWQRRAAPIRRDGRSTLN
ncbi:MAG: hypothetical protein JKX76_02305 [Colwellia sp.]|nr:hypothetical protein [Colwellia sp.]